MAREIWSTMHRASCNDVMGTMPTLVVISGPSGAGKTTLAHLLARRIGCPAICRDEIKEGMAARRERHG